MKLIADWTTKQYRCYFCGETRSVKYTMEVINPVIADKPVEVAVCNKCAMLHTEVKTSPEEN